MSSSSYRRFRPALPGEGLLSALGDDMPVTPLRTVVVEACSVTVGSLLLRSCRCAIPSRACGRSTQVPSLPGVPAPIGLVGGDTRSLERAFADGDDGSFGATSAENRLKVEAVDGRWRSVPCACCC